MIDEANKRGKVVDQASVQKDKKRRPKKFVVLVTVLALMVAGLGATSVVLYRKYQDIKQNPDMAAQENVQRLTEKVGKLITLPKETPTMAVVQDKEKLKDQAFFKDAQNGDKVLIYTAAKQAIIYREHENKLVNVGPVSLEEPKEQSDSQKPDQSSAPKETNPSTTQ